MAVAPFPIVCVPFEDSKRALEVISNLKLSKESERVLTKERFLWNVVLSAYEFLDPTNKGYIDFEEAMTRVHIIFKRQLQRIAGALLCVLENMKSYMSLRGVIERDIFLLVLKGWLNITCKERTSVPKMAQGDDWLIAMASKDVNINPFLTLNQQIIFPDLRENPFFKAPDSEVAPTASITVLQNYKLHREAQDVSDERLAQRHQQQKSVPSMLVKKKKKKDEHESSISNRERVDDCSKFENPVLGKYCEGTRTRNRLDCVSSCNNWCDFLNDSFYDEQQQKDFVSSPDYVYLIPTFKKQ